MKEKRTAKKKFIGGRVGLLKPSMKDHRYKWAIEAIRRRLTQRHGSFVRLAEAMEVACPNLSAVIGPNPKRALQLRHYLFIMEWLDENGL